MRIFATKIARHHRGFTLLELLVVLAIMASIIAIAIPNLRLPGFASDAAGAARQIASGLADARQAAIFANRDTSVVIDLENKTFSVAGGPAVALDGIQKLTLITAERDVLDEARGEILFYPDGSAGGGEISVQDQDGTRATVRVNWLTGRISVDG